jgi:hypothetical protein
MRIAGAYPFFKRSRWKLSRDGFEVEREAADLDADSRRQLRQQKSRPISDTLHAWLTLHRHQATEGTAIARAIDYNLRRWDALTRIVCTTPDPSRLLADLIEA